MRLLQLASITAFMSHLNSVSAGDYFICPTGTRFLKTNMHKIRDTILRTETGPDVTFHSVDSNNLPLYTFSKNSFHGGNYNYLIKVNLHTEYFWVYEESGGEIMECRP